MQVYQTLAELTASRQNKTGTLITCRENFGFYIVKDSGYTPTGSDITVANGRVVKFEFAFSALNIKTTGGNVQGDLDSIISGGLPTQSGNKDRVLTTDGTSASWTTVGLEFATTAEMQAVSPTVDGIVAYNQERANAKYILSTTATAQPGDITTANSNVWVLQVDKADSPDKFGSFSDALGRLDTVIGDGVTEYEVSAFTLGAGKGLKNLKLKYSGAGSEDFIDLDSGNNASNITIEGCVIDATGADDAIRGGKNPFLKIRNSEIFGCSVVGIQITGSAGATDNEGLEITGNYIHDTGHDSLEIRSSLNGKIEHNTFEAWGTVDSTSAAVEFQEYHENTCIQFNTIVNTVGTLFGLESAGSTARLINCQISNNIMRGAYTGISGKIDYCSITNNKFYDGNGNWRSGIEVIGEGNTIRGNSIYDGAISLASGGTKTPVQNVDKTLVEGNYVRSTLADGRAMYLGGEAAATGTPTCYNVDIKNNTFDMSDGSGTSTRVLLIGEYTNPAQIDNINIQGNTIIGPSGVSSTEGIRTSCLAGSGTVNIKMNTFKDLGKALRVNDDNLSRINYRFNDLSQGITNAISDASTTTVITNSENDV